MAEMTGKLERVSYQAAAAALVVLGITTIGGLYFLLTTAPAGNRLRLSMANEAALLQDTRRVGTEGPASDFLADTDGGPTSFDSAGGDESGIGGPAPSVKLDYAEAALIYPYRFQFLNNCNGIVGLPGFGTINVKSGAEIMLDNRDDEPHELAIGTQAYTVAAYDYAVAVAEPVEEPTGYLITCDGKGAGRLYVYP